MFIQQTEADLLVQDAVVALASDQLEAAEVTLNAALRVEPNHPMALTKLAEIALQRRDHVLATGRLKAALSVEPYFAPAWGELSHALWLAGRRQEALEAAHRAVHIQPPNPKLRLQLAQLAAWMGQWGESLQALAPLLAPGRYDTATHAAAISMRGELAIAASRFHEADTYLRDALRLLPALNATRMMLGMNQLRLGNFAEGWRNYAMRERIGAFKGGDQLVPQAEIWQGQDLVGKTILVVDDQGYGDAIQFFRYLQAIKALRPKHITLRTFAPLTRLFARAAPYATVLASLPDDSQFDYQCTSSSLPRWFGATEETIPAPARYLRPLKPSKSMPKLSGKRLRVGLAWSGDERHMRDHLRSIPADLFLTLADLPGIDIHSLQHVVRPLDIAALQARRGICRKIEAAADFADTAALMASLDLVITVDTAIAHLAGAMGIPVWIVLHATPDWRWMTRRADTPWYPTVQLFRVTPREWGTDAVAAVGIVGPDLANKSESSEGTVPKLSDGGWEPVVGRVGEALRALASA